MSSDKWTSLGQLSYDPILNQNIYSHKPSFSVKKGYYRNECFGLGSLSRFCTISITLIWSRILLCDLEYYYTISNALRGNLYGNLVVGFFSGIEGRSICSNVCRSSQSSTTVFILKTNHSTWNFLEHRGNSKTLRYFRSISSAH